MGDDHGNFIGGRWHPVGDGEGFAIEDATGAELTRRPRTSAGALEEALGVLEAVGRTWWERAPAERAEVVQAMDLGADLDSCAEALGARMGIESSRALQLLEDDLGEIEAGEHGVAEAPGIALVRCAPSALLSGLAPLVTRSLERGWCVLLLADPALPWLAESVARAWERAGGGAEALALLHDDGATTARSVLGSERLAGVQVRDNEERLADLEKAMAPRGKVGFGLGILEREAKEATFAGFPLCDATAVVTSECDPEEEAHAVCEAAFGLAEALGGEREGSLGRVVCHEGLFSTFTEALLERFDALEQAEALQRPLQQDLGGWAAELARAAVGDGATCLRGGPSDSIGRGGRGKIIRSVFTNVEPRWRLARARRPAPALALLRASDDSRAHELALACDAGHAHGTE